MTCFAVVRSTFPAWLLVFLPALSISAAAQAGTETRILIQEDIVGADPVVAAASGAGASTLVAPVPDKATREKGRHILI